MSESDELKYICRVSCSGKLLGKTLFAGLTDFDACDSNHFYTVQSGQIRAYSYANELRNSFEWRFSEFLLIRAHRDRVAASDLLQNILVFKYSAASGFSLDTKILQPHSKLITDMTFIELPFGHTYLASVSFDGFLKVFDFSQPFRPIFEYSSSKKWCFSLLYEPATLVLTVNSEGKKYPQKMFYFQEGVIARKFDFYNENVL